MQSDIRNWISDAIEISDALCMDMERLFVYTYLLQQRSRMTCWTQWNWMQWNAMECNGIPIVYIYMCVCVRLCQVYVKCIVYVTCMCYTSPLLAFQLAHRRIFGAALTIRVGWIASGYWRLDGKSPLEYNKSSSSIHNYGKLQFLMGKSTVSMWLIYC